MRSARAVVLAGALFAAPAVGDSGAFDLHAAIAAADEGATIVVPAGTYAGPLVLDRSVSLVAEGRVILDGGGEGDVITVRAPDVAVRGFEIRHTGKSLDRENAGITVVAPRVRIEDNVFEDVLFGIYLKGAPDSVISGNTIGGKDLAVQRRGDGIRIWQSHRTLIENNTVEGSRDAVMWFSDDVHLRGNRILNGRYGLHFMYSNDNVIEDNELRGNSVGAFLMYSHGLVMRRNLFANNRGPSGYGVGLKDMDHTSAEDNMFVGNRVGLHLDTSPASQNVHDLFTGNVFAHNDIGIAFLPAVKRNRFTGNTFLDNVEHVAVLGGGNFEGNDFTVDGRGNFWSDYRGYDLDHDGIGDVAYKAHSLFENLMDREPKLRLFIYSPAQLGVEMAAKAFPVVRPREKLTDTAPLMQAVRTSWTPTVERDRGGMALLAVGLLVLTAVTVWFGARPFESGLRRTTPARGGSS